MPENSQSEIADILVADIWEVIVRYSGDISRIETELNAEVENLGDGFAIITLPREQIYLLGGYPEITYIETPKILTLTLNQSLRISCISEVHDPEGYGLSGKGTIVGVIDSGIDYTHPDFRNPDGTSRILYLWDQSLEGTPPTGFKQGAVFDNSQINAALNTANPYSLVPSRDNIGHGTAVTGIAAGNGRASGGRERGTAYEASIIMVKMGSRGYESFARTTEIMRALKYILDQAEALNMPLAVNLSFGTNDGAHDGNSLFELYVSTVAQRWKTVIVAATGNEGAGRHHYYGEISTGETKRVNFVIAERLSSLYLSFWKNFVDEFTIELIFPDGNSTGVIDDTEPLVTKQVGNVDVGIYYGQPTHYNEDQEIYILIVAREGSIPEGLWSLVVNGIYVVEGAFDIWMPTVEEVGTGSAFTDPEPEATLTLPATAQNVLSVAGYNGVLYTAAQFSGRGFTRNRVYVKPDIAAPAVEIISTRPGGGYDSFTGTSMAAPFVTGAAALMMEWGIVRGHDPFLYGQRVKAFLRRGALRVPTMSYPNALWGYGTLCLKHTMDFLTADNPVTVSGIERL